MPTVDGVSFIADMLAEEPAAATAVSDDIQIGFEVKRYLLALLLEKASTVVPSKDIMPVLKSFQIEARPDRLRVVATDTELSMVSTTDLVSVTAPGIAVFPARKFLDIVRQAEDATVKVVVRAGTARVSIGRTTWTLKLAGGADYPPMPEIAEVCFAPSDRLGFIAALQAVRYAACKEATRASLMMVDVKYGKMTACDGARFAQANFGDFPFTFQVPIGAVDDLLKLLKSTDLEEIAIGEADNHLIFRVGADVFIINKLVAPFPDMEALLLRPALENKHALTVDRADLLQAIKRVRINADPETSAIALLLTAGHVTVQARDKFNNAANETIDAGWAGGDRTIMVNHSFLADMLKGYGGASCAFYLGDDAKKRKSSLMLKDTDNGTVAVTQQMLGEWVAG